MLRSLEEEVNFNVKLCKIAKLAAIYHVWLHIGLIKSEETILMLIRLGIKKLILNKASVMLQMKVSNVVFMFLFVVV